MLSLFVSLILTIIISIGICIWCRCRKSKETSEIPRIYLDTARILIGLEKENYFKHTLHYAERRPNGSYFKHEESVDVECQTSV